MNSQWICYQIRRITIVLFSSFPIYCELTILYANELWTHFQFREFTILSWSISWIHWISLSISFFRNHYKLTIFSQFHLFLLELTIFLAKLLRIHLVFRQFTMNTFLLSRIHFESIIDFTKSLLISRIKNECIIHFSIYYANFIILSWNHF